MRTCSRATARVLLPDPDRPVNQRVQPFCLRSLARSSAVTAPSCQVIWAALISLLIRTDSGSGRAKAFVVDGCERCGEAQGTRCVAHPPESLGDSRSRPVG